MWIGLNDIKDEETFTWEVDESNVEFSKWGSEQPGNGNNQDCVTVGAKQMFSLWEDHQCDTSHIYMCEKPASGKIFLLNYKVVSLSREKSYYVILATNKITFKLKET